MRGISLGWITIVVCALIGLTGLASTSALAITPRAHAFAAYLNDAPCGTYISCGSGKLTGFGAVRTRAVFRPVPPTTAGCLAVVGTRRLTLVRDPRSTLRLAVRGSACGLRRRGTFRVLSGSGVFSGATGSGVIRGSLTKTGHEQLRYSGVLTLAHK